MPDAIISDYFSFKTKSVEIIPEFDKPTTMTPYTSILKRDPNKRFGKLCIRETRITVYDVLGWLASGMTYDEIVSDFPEFTEDDIKACLSYAADREHKLMQTS